jgi:hypothetical protein
MSVEQDSYYNLAERIEDAFLEIDSDITTNLKKTDSEYAAMRRESLEMQQNCPAIVHALEGSGAISLTADEHEALLRYLDLERQIEDIERKKLYFRGHTDCFAYLKKIGII